MFELSKVSLQLGTSRFFWKQPVLRKLILEPPKIKKLFKVPKKSLLSVDKLLYYRSSNFSDFICDFWNLQSNLYTYIYIYIYIYRYIYTYIYICIYTYIQRALSFITTMVLWQLMHLGTWFTVTHCWYQLNKKGSCAYVQVHELPQRHCGDNREGTLFPWLHIYYAHLASARFEHSVCRGSLMTTYIYIYIFSALQCFPCQIFYITLFSLLKIRNY